MPFALSAVLASAIESLAESGVPHPETDAQLLLAHVLDVSRGRLQALEAMNAYVDEEVHQRFVSVVNRRAQREPLQHITGLAPFRYLELEVGPGVFVPRPETEFVTQVAIDALQQRGVKQPLIVDLCSGSAAIALAFATEIPNARVHGVEQSPEAFEWALRNHKRYPVTNLQLHLGGVADALPELDGTVQLVISNPPYIPDDAVPRDVEVRQYDPELALYGGPDGLDVIREVSQTARRLVKPGGLVVIEHGESQGRDVRAVLEADGWQHARTLPDLTARDRVTLAERSH